MMIVLNLISVLLIFLLYLQRQKKSKFKKKYFQAFRFVFGILGRNALLCFHALKTRF
jgi:hypothetical protein